jgi:D-alanyl-D-alanine carboxypeptidase
VQNNLDVFEGSEEAKWVYENCYRYGFIVRYKAEQMDVTGYIFEPWHIVYVGKEIAGIMHDENIETLEEYVVKYVDHQK